LIGVLIKNVLSLEFAKPLLADIRIFPVKLAVGTVPALTDLNHTAFPALPERTSILRVNGDRLEPLLNFMGSVC